MNGLELRKATLTAAGFRVFSATIPYGESEITNEVFQLILPDGTGRHGYVTEIECWQHAPAVESSVDAALECLALDEYHRWKFLDVPYARPAYWVAMIQDIRIDTHEQECAYSYEAPSLSDAMCRAYLKKAGA